MAKPKYVPMHLEYSNKSSKILITYLYRQKKYRIDMKTMEHN